MIYRAVDALASLMFWILKFYIFNFQFCAQGLIGQVPQLKRSLSFHADILREFKDY